MIEVWKPKLQRFQSIFRSMLESLLLDCYVEIASQDRKCKAIVVGYYKVVDIVVRSHGHDYLFWNFYKESWIYYGSSIIEFNQLITASKVINCNSRPCVTLACACRNIGGLYKKEDHCCILRSIYIKTKEIQRSVVIGMYTWHIDNCLSGNQKLLKGIKEQLPHRL